MSTTDPGGIRDSTFTCTDLTEICHRADSTEDLGELCCKSYNLPDPLIPALPSYESMGLPASCAFRPMTTDVFTPYFGIAQGVHLDTDCAALPLDGVSTVGVDTSQLAQLIGLEMLLREGVEDMLKVSRVCSTWGEAREKRIPLIHKLNQACETLEG
ncbi:uncharacterized protein UHOD_11169 [Ustilago sp. UG-2017b]|nr:uncharacterized protein UHOD_11169 [Ustilago sp. UG-2017b]